MRTVAAAMFMLFVFQGTVLAQAPDIGINPGSFDYNSVVIGESVDRSFVVSNTSTTDELIVFATELLGDDADQFQITGGGGGYILNAGSTRLVTIRFQPTKMGALSAMLRIESNDPDQGMLDVALSGAGLGVPDIMSSLTTVQYGSIGIGENASREILISNQGLVPLEITSTTIEGSDAALFNFSSGDGADTLDPLEQKTLIVEFAPTTDGDKNARLVIASNDPDEAEIEVALFGRGTRAEIESSLLSHNFGEVILGESASQAIQITNNGQGDLVVDSLVINGPGSDQYRTIGATTPFSVRSGEFRSMNLEFVPIIGGNHSANLIIYNNDPDTPALTISVMGVGNGVSDINVSTQALQFGDAVIGSQSSASFTLSNQGVDPLVILSAEVVGADADMFAITLGGEPDTLATLEQKTVQVEFSPDSAGDKNARLQITSNDPDESVVEISLFARGTTAEISSDVENHNFGPVEIGQQSSFTFFISNDGQGDLLVDSLALQGLSADQFSVSTEPFTVGPSQTRSLVVNYIPTRGGEQSAFLTLFSNDIDNREYNLILRGVGLGASLTADLLSVDFGTMLTGLFGVREVNLINNGQSVLNVSQFLITGGDSTAFSVSDGITSVSIQPADSASVLLLFSPETKGEKASTLRLVSNDQDQTVFDIPLSGIADEAVFNPALIAEVNNEFSFSIMLPEAFQPSTVELFYRLPGETPFRTVNFSGNGAVYTANIPSIVVTPIGIEYYIRVGFGPENVSLPAEFPETYPYFLPVHVPEIVSPVESTPWVYKMISVPMHLEQDDINAVLEDDLGPYDSRKWRLFRWENNDYVEYPNINGEFEPGLSFWLVTNDGAGFDIEDARTVDTTQPVTLQLEPGWNQIANPFSVPIPWPVQEIDPRVEMPASFNGVEFEYSIAVLEPWQGYFVQNLASVPLSIELKADEASTAPLRHKREPAKTKGEPIFSAQIITEVENIQALDTQTFVGIADDALEGHDEYDFSKAPPIGAFIQTSIIESEGRLASSFKPHNGEGNHWDLEIENTTSQSEVRLRLETAGVIPESHELFILDLDRQKVILEKEGVWPVSFKGSNGTRRLRLLIGNLDFIDKNRAGISLEEINFQLNGNYPNPFQTETVIQYQVGEKGAVQIEVYNLLGQRVRMLANKEHAVGKYSVQWDGRNDSGVRVASGVYLYKMSAESFYDSGKMLLVH